MPERSEISLTFPPPYKPLCVGWPLLQHAGLAIVCVELRVEVSFDAVRCPRTRDQVLCRLRGSVGGMAFRGSERAMYFLSHKWSVTFIPREARLSFFRLKRFSNAAD